MKKEFKWGQFEELNKELGFKSVIKSKKTDKVKKATQIAKFCKCRACGNMMTYVKGTNALICDCEVEREKEKVIKDKNGKAIGKETFKVKEPCGHVNLISNEYMGYVNYLFNED